MMQLSHKFQHMNFEAILPEMTHGEWILLINIEDQTCGGGPKEQCPRPPGAGHFAKLLECSPPMISKMLRSLEGKGMIVREVDVQDRRNTNIFLTEQGKEYLSTGKKRIDRVLAKAVNVLGEEKINEMLQVLEEFYEILKNELEDK